MRFWARGRCWRKVGKKGRGFNGIAISKGALGDWETRRLGDILWESDNHMVGILAIFEQESAAASKWMRRQK